MYQGRYLLLAKTGSREFVVRFKVFKTQIGKVASEMAVMKKVLVLLYMKQGSVKLIFKKIIISKKKFGERMQILFFFMLSILICRAKMKRNMLIL